MGNRARSFVLLAFVTACGKVNTDTPDAAPSPDATVITPDARDIDAMPADPFVNGSFESGDYTGWTLNEDSGNPMAGIWGIGTDGQVIDPAVPVHDFNDNIDEAPGCIPPGFAPLVASDGTSLAYNTQADSERHRMWQDLTIPVGLSTLSWSMRYDNTAPFDLAAQFLAIEVRDPTADTVIQNLFITDPATTPPPSVPMSQFTADLSAYAGTTIRITVDLQVQNGCFFAAFDGFALVP